LTRYLCKRLAGCVAVFLAALCLNFLLPRLVPGNPIQDLTSGVGSVAVALDPEAMAVISRYYGLDRPLLDQFRSSLAGMLQGDLGYSIQYRAAVSGLLWERFPWTLLLTLTSLALSFSAALLLGTRGGLRDGTQWSVLAPAVLLESIPAFVLGSMLLVFLGVHAGLFPLGGGSTPFSALTGTRKLLDLAHHAALPVLVLAASSFFSFYLVVRSSTAMVRNEPYVVMAHLKGLPERTIRTRYILRTALLPVVTFFGMRLAYSAGGAILVEVVFGYPGIGRLTYEAVLGHDYALLQGCFLTFTLWVLSVNLLTDCLYAILDPRVKEA